jgi:hypothetical protein
MGVPLFILQLLDWHFPLETIQLPSGHVKIAIEHGPVEIVDFPIQNVDVPSFFVCLPFRGEEVPVAQNTPIFSAPKQTAAGSMVLRWAPLPAAPCRRRSASSAEDESTMRYLQCGPPQ